MSIQPILDMPDDLPFAKSPIAQTVSTLAAATVGEAEHPSNFAGQLTTVADIRRYVEAGKATLTIKSRKTGTRFTYLFKRPPAEPGKDRPIWAALLSGPDNVTDYQFLGTLWTDAAVAYRYRHGGKSKVSSSSPSVLALQWLVKALTHGEKSLAQAEIWHEGRCGRCGRKLTVPESIANGLGPECAGKV